MSDHGLCRVLRESGAGDVLMKDQWLPLFALLLLGLTPSCDRGAKPTPPPAPPPMAGVWTRTLTQPPGATQVKMWTEDRFMWTVHDSNRAVMAAGYGHFTYQEGRYVERLEAVPANLPALLGKPLEFKLTFQGSSRLSQSGDLPGIGKVDEEYTRVLASPGR